jgi:hypothetical protein
MDWRVLRLLVTTVLALAVIAGSVWGIHNFVVRVSGQEPERMPGPIIEDPPGVYTERSFVPPAGRLIAPGAALSTFVVTYNGFTPQAQVAFQAAINVWASQLQSSVPIRVTANWTTLSPGVLGSAGANYIFRNFPGAPSANTWFASAVAKKLSGTDLTAGLGDNADIVANFNSSFGWYLGTDGNAGSQFDFMTVALHELGHGLGFFGSMDASGGTGSWGFVGSPAVYDLFAINGSSQSLLNTLLFPNPSSALRQQLISNNVYFNGTNAKNGNSGIAPKLYAPASWAPGSSYSHVDESTYPNGSPNSLMTFALAPGEVIHDLGPILRGMFTDMGWTVASPLNSTRGDYDGDAKADVAFYRPSTGFWHILQSITNGASSVVRLWGVSTDVPVVGDFDGDRKGDLAVYRPSTGTHLILLSSTNSTGYITYQWGVNGDIPVSADYDGDGKADIAVYRPSTSVWWILRSSSNFTSYVTHQWGAAGDVPVPGDYDGDHKTDVAIFRPGTGRHWVLLSSTNSTGYVIYQWGVNGDIPVSADYDGDGRADIAIYRPSTKFWWIFRSSSNFTSYATYEWGVSTDVPVPADYDGDGQTDIAIYRPATGTHWVLLSSTNWTAYATYSWGMNTDIPILRRP